MCVCGLGLDLTFDPEYVVGWGFFNSCKNMLILVLIRTDAGLG
jgi:hypothetical protein